MFMDMPNECVEFDSVKSASSDVKVASQQTEAIQFNEVGCSSFTCQDKDTQTTNVTEEISSRNYDQQKLVEFLQRAVPLVLETLDKNIHSHAFIHYEQLNNTRKDDIAKLHVLKYDDNFENLSCTGLSWNATGSVIGVVYGSLEHEGWCNHSSRIACWNIDRRNFLPSKPNTCISVSICLSCIEFHLTKPATFATGNYNGQISLWNLGYGDDPEVAKTETHDKGHNDVITCLIWIKEDGISDRYQLCSSSLDGKVLVWKYSERRKQLQVVKGFIILAEDLPSSVFLKKKSSGEVGVTSMSFFGDQISFIVAIEGGVIVLCSLESNKIAAGHTLDGIPLRSPVMVAISSPIPYVSHVTCSPYLDHFAVCGPYSGLYIYIASKMRDEPLTLFSINELTATSWYPSSSTIVGALSKGQLQLYNAITGGIIQESYLPEMGNRMLNMKFNHIDPKIVSIGDSIGEVHNWQLKTGHPCS